MVRPKGQEGWHRPNVGLVGRAEEPGQARGACHRAGRWGRGQGLAHSATTAVWPQGFRNQELRGGPRWLNILNPISRLFSRIAPKRASPCKQSKVELPWLKQLFPQGHWGEADRKPGLPRPAQASCLQHESS